MIPQPQVTDELTRRGVRWYWVGFRLYAECSVCHRFVCLNKPVIGSLHLCM